MITVGTAFTGLGILVAVVMGFEIWYPPFIWALSWILYPLPLTLKLLARMRWKEFWEKHQADWD